MVFWYLSLCYSIFPTKEALGADWRLIFYHNSTKGNMFLSKEEALFFDSEYKYSMLTKLDNSYKIGGKFEFLLEYPGISGHNRWRQTLNPIDDLETGSKNAQGYENINISWSGMKWGGLLRSTNPTTLIDGSYNLENYWYAIGSLSNYLSPSFPGPGIPGNADGTPVKVVCLWVRVNTLTPRNQIHKSAHKILFFQLFQLIANFGHHFS